MTTYKRSTKFCLYCGAITFETFCSIRCTMRYQDKMAALRGPTVMQLYGGVKKRKIIDQMVDDWKYDHECPDTCNGDANRMCYECYHEDALDEAADEYRKRLELLSQAKLEKEEYYDELRED